jgi:transcription antitermination factor NusG
VKTNAFEYGRVRIREGVFREFVGAVEGVNTDRRTLKVSVTMLGRSIVVELPVRDVTEID